MAEYHPLWSEESQIQKLRLNALHVAVIKGRYDDVKRLLDDASNKIDVNSRGKRGVTPLMLAALFGHSKIVAILMKKGAARTLRDVGKKSPYQYAYVTNSRPNLMTRRWHQFALLPAQRKPGAERDDAVKARKRYTFNILRRRDCFTAHVQKNSQPLAQAGIQLEDGFITIKKTIYKVKMNKVQNKYTVGYLVRDGKQAPRMMAISGWSDNGGDIDRHLLNSKAYTEMVLSFCEEIQFNLVNNPWDNPGGRLEAREIKAGIWDASHVEKKLGLFYLEQQLQRELGDPALRRDQILEVRNRRLPANRRRAWIYLSHFPCDSCLEFLKRIKQLSGIEILVCPVQELQSKVRKRVAQFPLPLRDDDPKHRRELREAEVKDGGRDCNEGDERREKGTQVLAVMGNLIAASSPSVMDVEAQSLASSAAPEMQTSRFFLVSSPPGVSGPPSSFHNGKPRPIPVHTPPFQRAGELLLEEPSAALPIHARHLGQAKESKPPGAPRGPHTRRHADKDRASSEAVDELRALHKTYREKLAAYRAEKQARLAPRLAQPPGGQSLDRSSTATPTGDLRPRPAGPDGQAVGGAHEHEQKNGHRSTPAVLPLVNTIAAARERRNQGNVALSRARAQLWEAQKDEAAKRLERRRQLKQMQQKQQQRRRNNNSGSASSTAGGSYANVNGGCDRMASSIGSTASGIAALAALGVQNRARVRADAVAMPPPPPPAPRHVARQLDGFVDLTINDDEPAPSAGAIRGRGAAATKFFPDLSAFRYGPV